MRSALAFVWRATDLSEGEKDPNFRAQQKTVEA